MGGGGESESSAWREMKALMEQVRPLAVGWPSPKRQQMPADLNDGIDAFIDSTLRDRERRWREENRQRMRSHKNSRAWACGSNPAPPPPPPPAPEAPIATASAS